jgi:hypothetical protein
VGGFEAVALASVEPLVRYHLLCTVVLTLILELGQGTVLVGQFDWGGFFQKSNGGV